MGEKSIFSIFYRPVLSIINKKFRLAIKKLILSRGSELHKKVNNKTFTITIILNKIKTAIISFWDIDKKTQQRHLKKKWSEWSFGGCICLNPAEMVFRHFLEKHHISWKNCSIKNYLKFRYPQKRSLGKGFGPLRSGFSPFSRKIRFFRKNGQRSATKKGYITFLQILKLPEVKHPEVKVKISTP